VKTVNIEILDTDNSTPEFLNSAFNKVLQMKFEKASIYCRKADSQGITEYSIVGHYKPEEIGMYICMIQRSPDAEIEFHT